MTVIRQNQLLTAQTVTEQTVTETETEQKPIVRNCTTGMDASSLACSEGITVEQYCAKNPQTQGCPGTDPEECLTEDGRVCPIICIPSPGGGCVDPILPPPPPIDPCLSDNPPEECFDEPTCDIEPELCIDEPQPPGGDGSDDGTDPFEGLPRFGDEEEGDNEGDDGDGDDGQFNGDGNGEQESSGDDEVTESDE